jgi:hypothetical protein
VCENPHVDMDRPAVAELMADVSAALARRVSVLYEDVYEVILREIPQLNGDKPVLALLASSVHGNVDTCLQVMQHRIDLANVRTPRPRPWNTPGGWRSAAYRWPPCCAPTASGTPASSTGS